MMKIGIILAGIVLLITCINCLPSQRLLKRTHIWRIQRYLEIATTKDYAETERRRNRKTRHALEKQYRWPKNTVPYHIWTLEGKGAFKADSESYKLIKKSMNDIEAVSCIRFKELKYSEIEQLPEDEYLKIFSAEDSECRTVSPGHGLGSAIFLKDAKEDGSDDHCMTSGTITHELLHVLGFLHEHQRFDREKFIKIIGANIKKDKMDAFKISRDFRGTINLGPYDRQSIMHYGNYDFSKNGEMTIVWKDDETLPLGSDVMSEMDKLKLNTYYGCPNFPTLKPVPDHIGQCPQSSCLGKTDGFYAHSSNKHLFITCKNGKAICQPCFPQNSVFVNRCGICMASDTEPCKTEDHCSTDLCTGSSTTYGLISHVHKKNMYVNCFFGQNFGCYECPDDHQFDDIEKKCVWRPNLS